MIKKINNQTLLFITKILLVLSWALFVFVAISKPMPISILNKFTWQDKIIHFFLFGVLVFFIIHALYQDKKDNFKGVAFGGGLVTFIYAWFCEYFQQYVPGRFQDNLDLLAGGVGILFFIHFSYLILQMRKPKILLHVCCASCGSYVVGLLKKKFRVFLYYYNPNIYPPEEYNQRLKDLKIISSFWGVPYINEEYNHQDWLQKIKGYEDEPEKGKRCKICFWDRLRQTARFARLNNFDYFTTTLTISSHKDFNVINKIGKDLEEKYGVLFLQENFKKKDGAKKATILSRGLGLYRQNYCGCEFSMRDRKIKIK